jgi:hypothetical protein
MQVKPFRPRYAKEVASLPDWVKPETGDEAMGERSRRTSRGERVQRAGTDQVGTWEARQGSGVATQGNCQRE